jgi:hypothetical protein
MLSVSTNILWIFFLPLNEYMITLLEICVSFFYNVVLYVQNEYCIYLININIFLKLFTVLCIFNVINREVYSIFIWPVMLTFIFFTESLSKSSLYNTSDKFDKGFKHWKYQSDIHTWHSFLHVQQRMLESNLSSPIHNLSVFPVINVSVPNTLFGWQMVIKIIHNLRRLATPYS